jgi:hypothetical protein
MEVRGSLVRIVDTVERLYTADLALLAGPDQGWLTTIGFWKRSKT